ncbi:MAG: DAK2 domain-containing protein, partial [Eubacteriales bacterium]
AMDYGVAAAYKAVMKPAEGTILTVSRYAAAAGTGKARETLCIEEVLAAAIEGGEVALADSVNVNPVLKKAGVVDAGGKGFLIILQGMLDSLQGKPMPMVTDFSTQESANFSDFSTDDITFAYCTEFICSRETQKNPDVMRKRLNDIGDSLVVVEDDEIIKVHVHTNEPNLALQEGLTYGQLLTVKIENMRQQHTEVIKTNVIAEPTQKYGFVTVCAGDGLRDLFRDLGANGIISGGQTMNPSTDDILNEINRTPAEIVYVFPNNKNIVMAAEQTIPLVTNKKVIVIPSKTVPQGMLAMMLMDPDGEEEQNTATMMEAITSITSAEITYAARDSDFDGNAITEGDFLGLLENQFFATEKTLEQVVEKLAQSEKFKSAEFITIYTGNDVSDEQNQAVKSVFETHCPDAEVNQLPGGQPVYYYIISAE